MKINQEELNNIHNFLSNPNFISGVPRYVQVSNLLERAIKKRIFTSNFLPSERVLAKLFNVSRATISCALQSLEDKKLITRQQGLGTQINKQLDYSLNQLGGFTQHTQLAGYKVSDRWLHKKKIKANSEIADILGITKNTKVAYLNRIRLIDDSPTSIEFTYIPLALLPKPENFTGSLYVYWQEQNIFPAKKVTFINAMSCNKGMVRLLNKSDNFPLLKVREITYNIDGQVLEVSDTFCLSDYYTFQFETYSS